MKASHLYLALTVTLLATLAALGQGTFAYDQQSFTTNIPINIEHYVAAGTGQSFVPSLDAIGFIMLELNDGSYGNGLGATVY